MKKLQALFNPLPDQNYEDILLNKILTRKFIFAARTGKKIDKMLSFELKEKGLFLRPVRSDKKSEGTIGEQAYYSFNAGLLEIKKKQYFMSFILSFS